MKRILIGVPSPGEWKADFGLSLAKMCIATQAYGDKEVSVFSSTGSMLSTQRTGIVKEALRQQATHVLFLDSDMVFPQDTLDQLLFWNEEVVAANCPIKMVPSQPTARIWQNNRWELVFSDKEKADLERVDRIGTAVMLLDMKIFERVKQPWFSFLWCGEDGGYQGEDWGFCERLEDAGCTIYIDHNVSKEIGHTGNFTFKHSHIRPEYLVAPKGTDYRRWRDRGVNGAELYHNSPP